MAGQAQTGTGKTAAFLIAIFTRLLREPDHRRKGVAAPRALVVAPTRELAVQIHSDACLLGGETGLDMQVVYGGVDYQKQRETLRAGVDLLIGTPGRLIDYFKQGVYELDAVEVLVIDRPTGCSIWGSSRTSGISSGISRLRRSGNPRSSPRP